MWNTEEHCIYIQFPRKYSGTRTMSTEKKKKKRNEQAPEAQINNLTILMAMSLLLLLMLIFFFFFFITRVRWTEKVYKEECKLKVIGIECSLDSELLRICLKIIYSKCSRFGFSKSEFKCKPFDCVFYLIFTIYRSHTVHLFSIRKIKHSSKKKTFTINLMHPIFKMQYAFDFDFICN